jgi:hypothetical protein
MDNQTSSNQNPSTNESLPSTEPETTSPPTVSEPETPPTTPPTEAVETKPSPAQPDITTPPESDSGNSEQIPSATEVPEPAASDQPSNPANETTSEPKTPPPPMPASLTEVSSDTPPPPDSSSSQASVPETFTIKGLITKTWQSLKLNFGKLILLHIFQVLPIAIIGAGIAVAFVSIIGGSIGQLNTFSESDLLNLLQSISLNQIGAIIGTSVAITFIGGLISTALSFAQISLVGNQTSTALGFHIKRGFASLLPYIGASIIVSFLQWGGLGLFIVPCIIISIYLGLFQFQIIIDNKSAMASLKGSATIVKHRFGYLLGRIGILFLINVVFSGIMPGFLDGMGESMELVAGLYTFIIGIGLSLFSIIYMVELYKEVRDTTDWNKPASLTWMWIVAIIGWIILIGGGYVLATKVGPEIKEEFSNFIESGTSESWEMSDQLNDDAGPIILPQESDGALETGASEATPASETTQPIIDEELPDTQTTGPAVDTVEL